MPPSDDGPRIRTAFIVSNGWHTVIVVPRPELVMTGLLPESEDFPDAAFLEFGWGDRVYFPARQKTLRMTLDAALGPTPAVMHMAGLTEPSSADLESLELALTELEFRNLVGAISGDFRRPVGGRAEPVSRGLSPESNFYDAHGGFHLLNTCNNWTARMLRAGGIDLSPSGIITADGLMARLRAAIGATERASSPNQPTEMLPAP